MPELPCVPMASRPRRTAGAPGAAWLESYTDVLRDREIILIPDRDIAGRARVVRIAKALFGHVAKLIILDLDHSGKDVSDWFAAGHSEVEFYFPLSRVQRCLNEDGSRHGAAACRTR